MIKYAIYKSSQYHIALPGDDIVAAVESGMPRIVADLGIGNAAGYRLKSIRAENGYLGGDAYGVLVTIVASGMPLVSGETSPDKTYVARLIGPVLDAPVEWALEGGKLVARAVFEEAKK